MFRLYLVKEALVKMVVFVVKVASLPNFMKTVSSPKRMAVIALNFQPKKVFFVQQLAIPIFISIYFRTSMFPVDSSAVSPLHQGVS